MATRSLSELKSPLGSRALAKGLQLVATVSEAKAPLSLGDLAASVRLGKPSALRLLQTLEVLSYLAKDSEGRYVPGPRIPGAHLNSGHEKLLSAAREEMDRLSADFAETVSLAALMEDHIRVVHTIESIQHIRMSNYLSRILPPYASSLGKAISAFQPPALVQALIQIYGLYQITDKTITEPVLIREDLARVRERGYAVEFEETVVGGCCFAAPIPGRGGAVRSALSVSLPVVRLTAKLEKVLPGRVMAAADRIARKMKGRE